MIEPALGEEIDDRARRAELEVVGAEDDAIDARVEDRPRAHRARLDRDVERRVVEAARADRRAGVAEGEHLGVGRRIEARLASVVAARDDFPADDDDRADRNLVLGEGAVGFVEREAEVALVVGDGVEAIGSDARLPPA